MKLASNSKGTLQACQHALLRAWMGQCMLPLASCITEWRVPPAAAVTRMVSLLCSSPATSKPAHANCLCSDWKAMLSCFCLLHNELARAPCSCKQDGLLAAQLASHLQAGV